MKKGKIEAKKVAIWMMLFLGFVLSQNVTWRIINIFHNNQFWGEKLQYFFQIEGACIYTLFAIYYTADRQWIEKVVERVPILKTIFIAIVSAMTFVFVWSIRCIFLVIEVFNLKNMKQEVEITKQETKQELEKYKKSELVVRILAGIGGMTIIIILLSLLLELEVVQCIADVANYILNIVLFLIVCANVKVPMPKKNET